MTAPIGEGAQSGADGTQSGTGESTTGNGTDPITGTGTQSGTETPTTDPAATQAKADAEAYRARMQAADQRAARFEAELKQLRDKDMPAQEKMQRDLGEAQKQVETLTSTNRALSLQVAFLKDNTYTWHSPETALKLVDLNTVEVDSEGNVSGLKDALKSLATSNPYLIKTEPESKPETPPTTSTGNNGSNGTGKPAGKKMASRFPVMNTRRAN